MDETKKRSFTELKNSMTKEQFKDFCRAIALKYANTNEGFSRSYFIKEYGVSQSCFYKVLEYAVINNLVDDRTVNKMEEKALQNQKSHAESAGLSSRRHYAELRQKRNENLISQFSEEEIKEIVEKYADNPGISKQEFAYELDVPQIVFDKLIKEAIEKIIVDDETFEKIKDRTFANTSNIDNAKEFFNVLTRKRNSAKEKLSS